MYDQGIIWSVQQVDRSFVVRLRHYSSETRFWAEGVGVGGIRRGSIFLAFTQFLTSVQACSGFSIRKLEVDRRLSTRSGVDTFYKTSGCLMGVCFRLKGRICGFTIQLLGVTSYARKEILDVGVGTPWRMATLPSYYTSLIH